MADNISYSNTSFTVPASGSAAAEIPLPTLDDLYENNSYGSTYNRNGVTYIFDATSSNHDIILKQNADDQFGIVIPKGTYYTAGPWRRASGAPKFLIGTNSSADTVGLTVIKITGASTCNFIYAKHI